MEGAGSRDADHQKTTLLVIKRKINALILFIQLVFKKPLVIFSSSKTNLPISIKAVNINGGSTIDDADRSHRYKYRTGGGTGKIMVQLCFGAALLMLSYSQQIQLNSLQQSPPPPPPQQQMGYQLQVSLPAFQLLQVLFILGFSTSLGGVLFSFIYPFTAKVLETSGTVFGVLGFFLAMGMVVDIYFKSLLWVILFTGAMTLVFILVNAVHELQGLWPESVGEKHIYISALPIKCMASMTFGGASAHSPS